IPTKALILTAHPDDEVMFFAPAILNLVKSNIDVYALCLSNGNADGLGQIREEELLASYARLGVRADKVRLINDGRLQDSMQIKWEPNLISEYVQQFSQHSGPFDLLLTFDKDGISQHANHKACSNSVPLIYKSGAITENGRIYALRSHSTAFKYLGLFGALVNHLGARLTLASQDKVAFLSTPFEYLHSLRAMSLHKSQMVWFRYLYLIFSTYM
ncbi:phosphatidylinositol glycan class L, partial [Meira miltonrushii]